MSNSSSIIGAKQLLSIILTFEKSHSISLEDSDFMALFPTRSGESGLVGFYVFEYSGETILADSIQILAPSSA